MTIELIVIFQAHLFNKKYFFLQNCIRNPIFLYSCNNKKMKKSRSKTRRSRSLGRTKSRSIGRCSRGYIRRSPYVRRSYVRKSGSPVRRSIVPSGCIRDLGKKGKGSPLIPPLKAGELKHYGYSTLLPQEERRASLKRASRDLTPLSVFRKLNAVATLTRNTNPTKYKKFIADRDWVRRELMY
jgi:hypothetical protein